MRGSRAPKWGRPSGRRNRRGPGRAARRSASQVDAVGVGFQWSAGWAGLRSLRRVLPAVRGAARKTPSAGIRAEGGGLQKRLLAYEVHAAGHCVALRALEHRHAETQFPNPAQEASLVGAITVHVRAAWGAARAVLIERPLHATLERQPPGLPDLAFELAHGQAYVALWRTILCQSRSIPPAHGDHPSANPHPCPLESCSGWFGSRQRVADSPAGQQESAESPARGAPARAFGEQAKPQYPVLILAAFLFAPSTTHASDGGGKKLLRRPRIGCHRIAPLLRSGDRLNAGQSEVRDREVIFPPISWV